MLNAIVRASIRWRGIVLAMAGVLFAYGLQTLRVAQYDVFPEFAPPQALVQVVAQGLSADQVEQLVTQPVENALGGLPGLASMRSQSLAGISLTTLTFNEGTDALRARQQAAERLSGLQSALPAGVDPPKLLPLTSSTSVALVAALTSTTESLAAVTDLARWTIKPKLMAVAGVSDVVVFGGEQRELQVQVDPTRLMRYGLTMPEVVAAARQSTGLRGAGFIEGANQRLAIRTEGQARALQDVADLPVAVRGGIPVRLSEVAQVRMAPQAPVGAATLNAAPAVMLVIESQYGGDPLAITQRLDEALTALRPALQAQHVELDSTVFRPAKAIRTSLGHLRTALLVGGALVIVVLFLFLYNVRTAIISACAIPLSLLAAVIVLHRFGVSLNTMTLGGLAIALGEVVDDAIIDVENIHRRLRENRHAVQSAAPHAVVWHASIEVRSAVVYATFIVALVFLPVLTLPGVAGQLFAPLAKAYVFAVLASLGVALTVTPALCVLLLVRSDGEREEPRLVQAIKRRYTAMLQWVEPRPRWIVGIVAALCVAAAACVPFLGGSFIPQLKEGHFVVHTALAPGTSLAEAIRLGNRLSTELGAIPGVRLVAQRAGRASDVVDPVDVNVSEFEVDLEELDGAAQALTLDRIRQTLAGFAGVAGSVNTFLTERIDETISGETSPVAVEIHGNDLDLIDAKAREVIRVAHQVPGAVGVGMKSLPTTPQLLVRLRPPMLRAHHLRPVEVLETVETAFEGTPVAQILEGNRVVDVVVILDAAHRKSAADVGALRVGTPQGYSVALSDVAEIRQVAGRAQIAHSLGQRLQSVTMGVRGRSVADFAADLQARIASQVAVTPGTYIQVRGEAQERSQAQRQLIVHSLLALAGITMLLWLALRSARALGLVLANLPFALVGGVIAVLLTGADLSLGSLVGFVTLFGITLRNSIMLISHYQHLVDNERMAWGTEAALRGAQERLVPILMTACVTALALLPLALRPGEPGNEVEGPMAIVILGGLVTSTVLNLLVLPALSLRFGRFEAKRADPGSTQLTGQA